MKRLITLGIALLMASFSTFAQKAIKDTKAPKEEIFQYVEQMPEAGFSISEYLSRTIEYPADAQKLKKEGRVIVKFVVTKSGRIDNVEVINPVFPSIDSTAIAVVKKMPKWKPGMTKGKAVDVYFTLPINFKLE